MPCKDRYAINHTNQGIETISTGRGLLWISRSQAATLATAQEKPAFRTRRWIVSTSESGGSLFLDGTSACGAEPAGSTPAEVRVVHRPTGTKDRQTTLSVATTEPPELTRALLKATLSTIPAEEEQMAGRRRLRDGPKGVERHPASKPSDQELARCREEAWHLPK